ncbi:MAG: twin-arginine translocase TatA/TatE family subunit [Epsilonproteobacteria bacterium]|nr:twin-arginine translocase TatA/TatE family subunit [Campylobacterota bacterium]
MGLSSTELIIILIIVVLLFGAKKIPELAKGIGSGIKNFKAELNSDDDKLESQTTNKEQKPEIKEENKA